MRYFLIMLTLVLTFSSSVQVRANDTLSNDNDNLEKLFEIMDIDAMVDNMWNQMNAVMMSSFDSDGMSGEEYEVVEKYSAKMAEVMKEEMSWEAMKPDMFHLYRQNFTESEIEKILEFYQSSAGQSMLTKMPTVMQESMQIGQNLAMNAMPKLEPLRNQMREELEELKMQEKLEETKQD